MGCGSSKDEQQFVRVEDLDADASRVWPVLKTYDQDHLARIAMPIGGIGTGTVSLGGRGDLRDWEIMNRPAKGYIPSGAAAPFFCIFTETAEGKKNARALEGPIEHEDYEDSHGSSVTNHGLPRFRECSFSAAYPLGQVKLSDKNMPVEIRLEAFNPFILGNADLSGIPVAVMRYVITNETDEKVMIAVCGNMPNFVGNDGWEKATDWRGELITSGEKENDNQFLKGKSVQGIFMQSNGVDPKAEQWGTLALTTPLDRSVTHRTTWKLRPWGGSLMDFWDDFSVDGRLEECGEETMDNPMASLAVGLELPARTTREVTFYLTWHFPNRRTWSPLGSTAIDVDLIGNYYTTQYRDAWDVAERAIPQIDELEKETIRFVRTFSESRLPEVVKEAALFNLSTLRTQTCFRTPDGRFFGWEGCSNHHGCCHGTCTHVWNYEQATAFLFGGLAKTMRDVEFAHATNEKGLMSFRVHLPLERAQDYGLTAADGQMGCIMKMYRDWQLSGDDEFLKRLWPKVRKALEFCWIDGGWDADRDGVMEGCQHNTMDVEYYGPNPQMGLWYLGALRAAEEMARYIGEASFAERCRDLYKNGSAWIDANLFNGEYYEHEIRPPKSLSEIAEGLRHNMGARDVFSPDYQLGSGCLVDQLVGQFMAHVCGLGYLIEKTNVDRTLQSIMKYNLREGLSDHMNNMRSFVLGEESALLMASYPKDRPRYPFPYFPEAMTGFEYTAAVGMLFEGQLEAGLTCIRNIRDRYDGRKRSPFDEAECGHHYARAMASWAAVLALTGFHFSGVDMEMTFSAKEGSFFWSNGYAWGNCSMKVKRNEAQVELSVLGGELALRQFRLDGFGLKTFDDVLNVQSNTRLRFRVHQG